MHSQYAERPGGSFLGGKQEVGYSPKLRKLYSRAALESMHLLILLVRGARPKATPVSAWGNQRKATLLA